MTTQSKIIRDLDKKLTKIKNGKYTSNDFIIADAKDADMAFGVMAPQQGRSRFTFLSQMEDMVKSNHVDIMLTSASNGEYLYKNKKLNPKITLAVRANDSSDVWNPRMGTYTQFPALPFRSVNLKSIKPFCDLVLYSVTFNNDLEHDLATLKAFKEFRLEAQSLGIRYFLEVFNPNVAFNLDPKYYGEFVNDNIVRMLAGLTKEESPIFLKIAFNGEKSFKELSEYDPSLIIGILGGSAGTTRDTFELLSQAEKAGARVALFGRKIQKAESQLTLIKIMREVVEGKIDAKSAVKKYHDSVESLGLTVKTKLSEDSKISDPILKGL
jgi:DhnA family fructose-bisphosphate aldolase class Ia